MAERSYRFPAKDAVREGWMRYLPPVFTHADDRVLYLPARENLELPLYLQKGLSPGQLIGAEHDSGELPFVQAGANGIQLVSGNIHTAVEHIVRERMPLLRAANLDFDGRSHSFTEELIALARVMPSPRGSYLAITSYAARDKGALIQGTVNIAKIFTALGHMEFLRRYGNMLTMYEHLLAHIPRSESSAMAHFQREMGLLWWIILMFGVIDKPREGERYYRVNQEFLDESDAVLEEITERVAQRLGANSDESEIIMIPDKRLAKLLKHRKVCARVTSMQRLAYWSSNRQPMRTWMFTVQPLADHHPPMTMQDSVQQVWDLACSSPLIYFDELGIKVTIEGTRR